MNEFDKRVLKEFLDEQVLKMNIPGFIENDPVQFPRAYDTKQDQEIAGFLTALISWGRRPMILRNVRRMLDIMGSSPYMYIMETSFQSESDTYTIHRTFNSNDFTYICKGLKHIYLNTDTLEDFFVDKDLFDGIQDLREKILLANQTPGHHAEKHLSSPARKSACKRIHMFLRWMIRKDGIVDLGIWNRISPDKLYIPLDVHVANVSRNLGLLLRKQNDRRAVEELTSLLREFDPDDPIKYDFALFSLGEQKTIL